MSDTNFRLRALSGAAVATAMTLMLLASPRPAGAVQVRVERPDRARFTGFSLHTAVPGPAGWSPGFAGPAAAGGLARRRNGGRS